MIISPSGLPWGVLLYYMVPMPDAISGIMISWPAAGVEYVSGSFPDSLVWRAKPISRRYENSDATSVAAVEHLFFELNITRN